MTFQLTLDAFSSHRMCNQAIYLDLESEIDRAKLAQAELYLSDHLDKLVILDEIHRAPGLFPVLRGLIDQAQFARNLGVDGKTAAAYHDLMVDLLLVRRHGCAGIFLSQ